MLTFAEEILLLALDDTEGTLRELPVLSLENALGAAVLMELAFLGRIDNDQKVLRVVDPSPTGDAVLDTALGDLRALGEDTPITDGLDTLFLRAGEIRTRILDRLVHKGVLRVVDRRILWVFAVRRYPKREGKETQEVRGRLRGLLLSDEIPDPRDAALVALVDACRLWDTVFSEAELDRAAERIRDVARMDLIGQATLQMIRRLGQMLFTPQPF
ncbi:MAG: GPP34 family phosphoprotein [Acidobacteria bacterium]|nr:GPP34 family phosphoprotein [Acidobacteriota bacterium]